jgi:hypothetical protein
MSNVFRFSAHNYFQISRAWLPIWYTLAPSSKDLCFYLCNEAERYSSPILTRSTKTILETTGMSKRAFIPARRELADKGIARSEEVGRGLWEFTIETYDKSRMYDELTTDEVEAYYTPHLKRIMHDDNNTTIIADCPFHDKRASFFLTIAGEGIGHWRCLCKRDKDTGDGVVSGGFEKFEMRLRHFKDNERDQARSNIAVFLADYRKHKEEEREVAENLQYL